MPNKKGCDDKREREKRTVETMIGIYCRGNRHGGGSTLCSSCDEILQYANERVDRCPFMETKTFCSSCTVHCYKEEMRERIRTIMRYSGPRMILYHPILAIQHIFQMRKERKGREAGL